MNTYKAYNKRGRSKQIIALMLVLVLSLGQMAIAMANTGSVFDPNTGEVVGGNTGTGTTSGAVPPSGDGEGGFVFDPNIGTGSPDEGTVVDLDSVTTFGGGALDAGAYLDGGDQPQIPNLPDGVTVSFTITTEDGGQQPGEGGGVVHTQIITVSGSINDAGVKDPSDPEAISPILKKGMSLKIKFPSYLTVDDASLNEWLKELKDKGALDQSKFNGMVGSDLVLNFSDAPVLEYGFDLKLRVDVTKFDGENDQKIIFEFDDGEGNIYWTDGGEGGIHINPGVPPTAGIEKQPFGNNFVYIGNGVYKIEDLDLPLEYRVGLTTVAMQENSYIEIVDEMSKALQFCLPDGTLYNNIMNPESIFIFDTWPSEYTREVVIYTDPVTGKEMFKITIRLTDAAKASIAGGGSIAAKQVVFRYYAKVVDTTAAAITNKITMVAFETEEKLDEYDDAMVLAASSNALMIDKKIVDGAKLVDHYAIPETTVNAPQDVTFNIEMWQIMEGAHKADNTYITADELREYFKVPPTIGPRTSTNGRDEFRLQMTERAVANAGRTMDIVKNGAGKPADGKYNMPFTVGVDETKLLPGQRGRNDIFGKTVFVYRNAWINITKNWLAGEAGTNPLWGNNVQFELRYGSTVIARSGVIDTTGQSGAGSLDAVLFVNYLNLDDKENNTISIGNRNLDTEILTFELHEVLAANSDYGTAQPIEIKIKIDRVNGTIEFVTPEGNTPVYTLGASAGIAQTAFENKPDDFKGELKFNKKDKGNAAKLLNGGKFELRLLTADPDITYDYLINDTNAHGQLVGLSKTGVGAYVPGADLQYFSIENGAQVSIKDLFYGTYRIVEIEEPTGGYILPSAPNNYVEIKIGKGTKYPAAVTLQNEYFDDGEISIIKVDEKGNGVENAIFRLFKSPNFASGSEIGTKVSDGINPVKFTGLDEGSYKIVEVVPSGFQNNGNTYAVDFQIDKSGNVVTNSISAIGLVEDGSVALKGSVINLTWRNQRKYADLELLKYDGTAASKPGGVKTGLANVEFTLEKVTLNVDGSPVSYNPKHMVVNPANGSNGKWITDANGKITFTDLEFGFYLLSEVESTIPPGYEARPEGLHQVMIVTEDNPDLKSGSNGKYSLKYEWPNPQQTAKIKVIKKGEGADGKNQPLAGVEFGLYTYIEKQGRMVYEPLYFGKTNASGEFTFPLSLDKGTYYVKETAPIFGYDEATHSQMNADGYVPVEVGVNNNFVTVSVEFLNLRLRKDIELYKHLSDEASVSGIVFTLSGYDFEGKAVTKTATTNASGVAHFAGLPYSNVNGYTIKETTGKPGYALVGDITGIVIDENSPATTVVGNTSKTAADAIINEHHEVIVVKYDAGEATKYLAGAEFIVQVGTSSNYVKAEATATPGVYKYVGTQTKAQAEAAPFVTLGSEGEFKITHLPATSYRLHETKAPEGYNKLSAALPFSVAKNTKLTYWRVSNSTIKGNLVLTKTGDDGKLLQGVGFRITGPNGYDETLYTDASGKINKSGLLYGDYLIVDEVNTPPEYIPAIDPADDTTFIAFKVGENGATVTLDIVNPSRAGKTKIIKTDLSGSKRLQNAMFIMRPVDDTGKIVTNGMSYFATSNANGEAEFTNIPYGFYAIQELSAPYGYVLDPVIRYVSIEGAPVPAGLDINAIIIDGGYRWVNDSITGELVIQKVDDAGVAVPGAEFKLYHRDASGRYGVKLAQSGNGQYVFDTLVPENDAEVTVITTTDVIENGKQLAKITNLPYGIYDIEEITVPDGHVAGKGTYTVYVTEATASVLQVVENPRVLGRLEVLKVDADPIGPAGAFLPLPGAVVRLYAYKGSMDPAEYENGIATRLGEVTTDAVGTGAIENIPMGEYVAIEEVAPLGYGLGADADRVKFFELKISDPNYTHKLRYENNKLDYKLKIIKVDKDDNQVALPGAKFKVVDQSGWGPDPENLVTDANGEILLSSLPAGTYTVQEIEAPKGYKLDDTKKTVVLGDVNAGDGVIDPNDPALVTYTAENELVIGKVELLKVDGNGKQLEGAEFQLLDENDTVLKLRPTGAGTYDVVLPGSPVNAGGDPDVDSFKAGKVTISGLPMGKYTFKETKAPDNYVILGNGLHAFEITADDHAKVVAVKVENLPEDKPALAIRKVDNVDRNYSLAGAEFTLYKSTNNGSTYTELVTAKTTDASGIVTFTDLEAGLYELKETKAPTGYKLPSFAFNFTVAADGKITITSSGTEINKVGDVYTVTFTNTKEEQQLRFKKVDSNTGVALPGAIFTLTGNGVSETLTAGSDGHTPYVTLNPGTYTLTEIKAPDGYQLLSSSSTIVVTASGISVDGTALAGNSPFTFTVNNTPRVNRILLYKTDSRSGNPLSGAVFSVTPRSGGNGVTLTTNASGQSNVITVTPGTYDIVETTAPSGYTRPLSGWVLQVNADGTASVSGTGITSWTSGGVIVINITNTSGGTTTTPTPTPGGGGGGGSTTSSGGGGGGSSSVSTPAPSQIPLGPGLPQTGELTNTQALMLGASLLLLSLIALLLFVALGGKREDAEVLPALM